MSNSPRPVQVRRMWLRRTRLRRTRLRRTRLRRILPLVLVAFLGAALLVRVRLSRPQAEGDKWLWEMGEQTPSLMIQRGFHTPGRKFKFDLARMDFVVEDRQNIRALLRAFQGTPGFAPNPIYDPYKDTDWWIFVQGSDGLVWEETDPYLVIYRVKGRYFIVNNEGQAKTDAASVKRFLAKLRGARAKAS